MERILGDFETPRAVHNSLTTHYEPPLHASQDTSCLNTYRSRCLPSPAPLTTAVQRLKPVMD